MNSIEQQIQRRLRNPDLQALETIHAQHWTSHNIPLAIGDATIAADVPLISEDTRTVLIKKTIRRFVRREELRIIDLGSLEGGVSFEMAREGWTVEGLEARRENFDKAELIRGYFALPNLRFALRDVKTLSRAHDGLYDVALCCGLLYHLDQPFSFLRNLNELLADDGLLFLDTHVAPETKAGLATHREYLSPEIVQVTEAFHSYEGRWFAEPREGTLLDAMWSAVSNERSFWPTRRSLIRGLYHAGFHSIYEMFGAFEIDGEFGLRDQYSRLYLACMKEW